MVEEQTLKTGSQELEEKADYNMRYYAHLMKLSKEKPAEFWDPWHRTSWTGMNPGRRP